MSSYNFFLAIMVFLVVVRYSEANLRGFALKIVEVSNELIKGHDVAH